MKFKNLTLLYLIYNLCVIIFDIVRLIVEGFSVVVVFLIIIYSITEFLIIAVLIKKNRASCEKKGNYKKNDADETLVSQTIINEDIIAKNSTTNIVNTYSTASTTFTKKEN
ncbi:MAG: hypothetical protein K2K41_04330 [Ruminiclostridium sp.]|nr:hypothetical protein [Ruminiclostridium sp.]